MIQDDIVKDALQKTKTEYDNAVNQRNSWAERVIELRGVMLGMQTALDLTKPKEDLHNESK